MKKTLAILAAALLMAVSFSSCKKLLCQCQATGYTSQEELQRILNKHLGDCVEIAESGEAIHDSGVVITCEY